MRLQRGHGTSWITNHRRFTASRVYLCATVTKLFSAKWRDFWPYTPYN